MNNTAHKQFFTQQSQRISRYSRMIYQRRHCSHRHRWLLPEPTRIWMDRCNQPTKIYKYTSPHKNQCTTRDITFVHNSNVCGTFCQSSLSSTWQWAYTKEHRISSDSTVTTKMPCTLPTNSNPTQQQQQHHDFKKRGTMCWTQPWLSTTWSRAWPQSSTVSAKQKCIDW